jgi:AraC-like DNA-binding protein
MGLEPLRPSAPTPDVAWILGKSPFFEPAFSRIWIICKGRGHVSTRFGEIDLEENNVYFMPSNSIITTFLYEDMEQYYIDFFQNPNEIPVEQLYSFKYVAPESSLSLLYALAKSLADIYKKEDDNSKRIVSSTLTTILTHFIEKTSDKRLSIQPAVEYISKNYSKPFSLTFLANLCDYSPEYFSSKFKALFGVSPQKYIISKRLTHAKILLLSSNKSILEIGKEVGYPDPMHFSKIFTSEVGVSPSAYRKSAF